MGVQINGATGNVIATKGTFSGNVGIAGTLTYEDVTDIDAVGLITARNGIEIGASPGVGASISRKGNAIFSGITTIGSKEVGAGITLSPDGDIFATGVTTTGSLVSSGAISGTTGTFTGDVDIADKIIHTGDTNTAIRFPAADTITSETGGSERLRIDSSGGVHIATTSGNEKLNVHGAIRASGSSANFNAGLEGALVDYDTSNNIARFGHVNGASGSARSVTFLSGGTERLRIGSAGQLGIAGANYGTSGQFLQSQGASSAVQWASVSSDMQFASWRVTTGWSGNTDPITNFSERNNNVTMGYSSGIFTFPSTGYWHIMFQTFCYYNSDQDNIELHLMTTLNNSSYSTTAQSYSHMNNDDGGNLYTTLQVNHIFDVTDTSNCKVKFKTAGTSANFHTDSSSDQSYAIFKRLAAT